ncbi:MAG: transposase [Victivallales bacterium]|nr:transposase [Victivallales bacterium]
MSYTTNYYHVIFHTARDVPSIAEEFEKELFKYIWGFCKNKNAFLHRVNGMPNHLHNLVDLPPSLALADFVRELKTSTHHWLKCNPHFPLFTGWSSGYAGLSCGANDLQRISNYIANQKQHHRKQPFMQEIRELLVQQNLAIQEKFFVLDWG